MLVTQFVLNYKTEKNGIQQKRFCYLLLNMFIFCDEMDLIVNNNSADQRKEALSGIAQDVDNPSVIELLLALIWEGRVLQYFTWNNLFHSAVKKNIHHKCASFILYVKGIIFKALGVRFVFFPQAPLYLAVVFQNGGDVWHI